MKRRNVRGGGNPAVRIALTALLAAMLILSVLPGCGRKGSFKMKEFMTYTEAERELIDDYLNFSRGVKLSLFTGKNAAEALWSGIVPDFSTLPDCAELAQARYVRASAYICFAEDGNQHLKLSGVSDTDITVTYNELHTEPYDDNVTFKAGAFYKLNVGYRYQEGKQPLFAADSEYELSSEAPSFGGIPSEPLRPMADIHMRDPFVLNAPDGHYYLIGTYEPKDWHNTREIHIYRSDDLSAWEDLGAVWSYERDATWQKDILGDESPIWAPELHYLKGTYWICYSLGWGSMSGSLLKSTTGLPEGPYEDVSDSPIFDYIDATLFEDGGRIYAIWSDGQIAELNDDLTALKGPRRALKSASGIQAGFDGCYMIKLDGVYYLCSSTYCIHYRADGTPFQTYDSFYVFSDNLFGPYSERRLLLQYGGHNNLFRAKDGKLYTTTFYGPDFSERPAIAEIEVTEEGLLRVK